MQLLEHVAKAIAAQAGIPVPQGEVARTPAEARAIAERLGGRVAIKAQVPIGGRGHAGGIVLADAAEAGAAAARLLGSTVRGFPVEAVLVEEAVPATRELYLAVTIRPAERDVVLLLSGAGGVDVETQGPERLGLVTLPIGTGLRPWHVWQAAAAGGVEAALVPGLIDVARRLHDLFWSERAELVEINPLFVVESGQLVAGDVRIVPDPEAVPDDDGVAPELKFDFLVLNPEGRVGLVTTGAGGSMHLIDRLQEAGLAPIDFCDLRTGRPRGLAERLTTAFRRLAEVPSLGCVAINFFAGVTILDEIAPILLDVIRASAPAVPIVARVEGRGALALRASLAEIGVRCAASLDELVEMVRAAIGDDLTPRPLRGANVDGGDGPLRAGDGEHLTESSGSDRGGGGAISASDHLLARPTPVGAQFIAPTGGEVDPGSLWRLLDDATGGVIVQGMTGQIGRRHTGRMRAYGTPIVAGVTPGRGGSEMDGVPVFNTVAEAVTATGARTSVAFLPGAVAPDGIVEAAEAGIGLVVLPTEGMLLHDTLTALEIARRHGTRVIGPNTGGLLVPERLALGFLPSDFARPGPVAVLSRSGTLSYETVLALSNIGLGVSVWIGVGGDRVKGSTFADLLPDLLQDGRTGAIVLLGEIGGTDEEDAAALVAGTGVPVAALLAGRTAPEGVSMGHAGAIVNGSRGSYASKRDALRSAGVSVAGSPTEVASTLRARLASRGVK
jgi:succinyl-CoA synthetase alpha subunit